MLEGQKAMLKLNNELSLVIRKRELIFPWLSDLLYAYTDALAEYSRLSSLPHQ